MLAYIIVYVSTLQECIPDDLKFDPHAFADDHVYKKLFDANSRLQEYKTHCMRQIKIWMDQNRLKMKTLRQNSSFLVQKDSCHITTELDVNGNNIQRLECI